MARFRSKPRAIEAVQWRAGSDAGIPGVREVFSDGGAPSGGAALESADGTLSMYIADGDWVILDETGHAAGMLTDRALGDDWEMVTDAAQIARRLDAHTAPGVPLT